MEHIKMKKTKMLNLAESYDIPLEHNSEGKS